jgi:hypothetical protein
VARGSGGAASASLPELTASIHSHLDVLRRRKAAGLPLPGPDEDEDG